MTDQEVDEAVRAARKAVAARIEELAQSPAFANDLEKGIHRARTLAEAVSLLKR